MILIYMILTVQYRMSLELLTTLKD